MFCSTCGSRGEGSFCETCGASLDEGAQKSGQLFNKSSTARPSFFKSKLVIAAGVLALLFTAGSSVLLVMLNSAYSTQQAASDLVTQHTLSLGQAEAASDDSWQDYMGWLGCTSSTWVCDLVYGNGVILVTQYLDANDQVDSYKAKLQQEKQNLARATEYTEGLRLTLQTVAFAGVLSVGALLAGQGISSKGKSNKSQSKKKKKVGK